MTHIISGGEDPTAEGGEQRQLSGGMQEAEPWRTQGEPSSSASELSLLKHSHRASSIPQNLRPQRQRGNRGRREKAGR